MIMPQPMKAFSSLASWAILYRMWFYMRLCFTAEEEYLLDAINPAAYYVGPEMQALQTASAAVSKMADEKVSLLTKSSPDTCHVAQHLDAWGSHLLCSAVA